MTIYLLGGSSTIMSGGWADSFATGVIRRYPVRNLAIGAGNTLMSLIRLTQEVSLTSEDIVVWANPVRDVMCLSAGGYQDTGLLRYTEELIRHVGNSGARFIPLLLDSLMRDMDVRQPAYKQALLRILSHYGLDWIDVTAEFALETGMPRVPIAFFDATGHIVAGSEMVHFVADLVKDEVASGRGAVRRVPPIHMDPGRPTLITTQFKPLGRAEVYSNSLLSQTLWKPGLKSTPEDRPAGDLSLEALVLLADPKGGALDLRIDTRTFTISAGCLVDYYGGPMLMTAYLPNMFGRSPEIGAGETLHIDWARSSEKVHADQLFDPQPSPGPSRSRVGALVFRHRG